MNDECNFNLYLKDTFSGSFSVLYIQGVRVMISFANRNAVINEQGVQNSTESHTLMFWKLYFVEKFSSEYALTFS